jgi:branched-chain amino acid transport system ATP-binding protein
MGVKVSEPEVATDSTLGDRDAHAIEVNALSVTFGGVRALIDITASVKAREIVAIIGPNGAGKTTLLNAICGLVRKSHGTVRHFDNDISAASSTNVARGGIGRSFQDPPLLDSSTVIENILCGAHTTIGYTLADQVFRRGKVARREREARAAAIDLLQLAGLEHLADIPARELSYGARKVVDIVRATVSKPSVLLLDEPSSGLDGVERARVEVMLLTIHRMFDLPMLVVEHHMDVVRAISDHVLGLVSGTVAMRGPTDEVLDSEEFRASMTGDTVHPHPPTAPRGQHIARPGDWKVVSPDA